MLERLIVQFELAESMGLWDPKKSGKVTDPGLAATVDWQRAVLAMPDDEVVDNLLA
eukprot:gene24417-28330_t